MKTHNPMFKGYDAEAQKDGYICCICGDIKAEECDPAKMRKKAEEQRQQNIRRLIKERWI